MNPARILVHFDNLRVQKIQIIQILIIGISLMRALGTRQRTKDLGRTKATRALFSRSERTINDAINLLPVHANGNVYNHNGTRFVCSMHSETIE